METTWGNIFNSEEEFLEAIDKHDRIVQDCARGVIAFDEFLKKYRDFYFFYALDGHESEENEIALFEKYQDRIRLHEELAMEILNRVCSDEDAPKQSYINAGRFGSIEAVRRLKDLNNKYFRRHL